MKKLLIGAILALGLVTSASASAPSLADMKSAALHLDNNVFSLYKEMNNKIYGGSRLDIVTRTIAQTNTVQSAINTACGGGINISISTGTVLRTYNIVAFTQNLSKFIKVLVENKDKERLTRLAYFTSKQKLPIHEIFTKNGYLPYSSPIGLIGILSEHDSSYLDPVVVALKYVCYNNGLTDPIDGMNSELYNSFVIALSMGDFKEASNILDTIDMAPLFNLRAYLRTK